MGRKVSQSICRIKISYEVLTVHANGFQRIKKSVMLRKSQIGDKKRINF